jgi:polysaccharide biosynthesis transport protein
VENQTPDIKDYLKVIKRRKKFIIIPFILISLLSVILSVVLPSIFRSKATILIEEQEIPSELVKSTVTTFADQRIHLIKERIMSRANLMEIVKKFNLYENELKSKTEERVLDKMRKSITIDTVSADVIDPRNGVPTKATIAFILAFDNPSASLAQKVANEMVSLFLKENIKSRTDAAENAAVFFTEEKKRLKDKIVELQAQLAEFKDQNLNLLPETTMLNKQELTSLTTQLMNLDNQERSIQERRVYLEGQLSTIDPNSASTNSSGGRVFNMRDRLKELQSTYPSLVSRYSESHPDVLKMKKEIESLQKEIGSGGDAKRLNGELTEKKSQLASRLKQYSEIHPDVQKLQKEIAAIQDALAQAKPSDQPITETKPDNPAYISLQTQIEAANSDMRSLMQIRSQLQSKIDNLRQNLHQAPLIEKEYMDLMQELENTHNRYKGVDAREMEALIAQQLELQKKGERFTLIEPPQEPLEAYSPNRPMILIFGIILAIATGFGLVALTEVLDSTVHSEKAIAAILGASPLASIPYLESYKEHQSRKQRRYAALIISLASIAALFIAFHFIIMPLDVFWYKLLRVVGAS